MIPLRDKRNKRKSVIVMNMNPSLRSDIFFKRLSCPIAFFGLISETRKNF